MAIISSNGYKVVIGDSFKPLNSFLAAGKYSQCVILCDDNTSRLCLPLLILNCPTLRKAELIEIENGESSKALEIAAQIWRTLLDLNADRNMLLINLGGGVVSDLGGFAASVYKRGIAFINLPTTLLAMADASVGGKTAIDFENTKNLIGTFSQPAGVFIHPAFLQTLPGRQFKNGLAEVYKIALVSSHKFWKSLKSPPPSREMITEAIRLKNVIVKKDPFDRSDRMKLNFGHTVGHALEAHFFQEEDPMLHGEAILAGMIIEASLSQQKKMISRTQLAEICSEVQKAFDLPDIKGADPEVLLTGMLHDKKKNAGKLRFSLLNGIGSCSVNMTVTSKQLAIALEFYNRLRDAQS
jgi:3-dehydroquinate synthase